MIRKIIKIGNSDGVVIPVGTMRAMKLKAGYKVEIVISEPGGLAKQIELAQELHKLVK